MISAVGNYVAYVSAASNLVAGQAANGVTNVLLYRVADATNALVSGSSANPANGNSDSPALGLDGRYVAYRSDATDLVAGQGNAGGNVFEYDRATRTFIGNSPRVGVASNQALQTNADGSIDIYFATKAPPGQEPNWIYTAADRDWFAIFHVYGPQTPLLEKTWRLPDIEAVGTAAEVLEPTMLSRIYGIGMSRMDREGKTPVVFPEA